MVGTFEKKMREEAIKARENARIAEIEAKIEQNKAEDGARKVLEKAILEATQEAAEKGHRYVTIERPPEVTDTEDYFEYVGSGYINPGRYFATASKKIINSLRANGIVAETDSEGIINSVTLY